MTVGQRIAQKRKELGLSQEGLGEQLGVSRQAIYKWESDATLPEIEKLISLSRIFSVSVGWLLGEEEQEFVPEDKELTEDQLRMVETIVDRYLAAQPKPEPPKKRRWPWVLGAVAVIAVVAVFFSLFEKLESLYTKYSYLQSSISAVENGLANQIGSITDRVEEILHAQNELTAEWSTEVKSMDIPANTVTFHIRVVPKTYREGMTALFVARNGETVVETPVGIGEGNAFEGDVTCPLTDDIDLTVVFLTEGQRETQVLDDYRHLYSGTFPGMLIMGSLWMNERDGVIPADGEDKEHFFYSDEDYMYGQWRARAVDIKVGLFKDQKLVQWYREEMQEVIYNGERTERLWYFWDEVVLEEGSVYCEAAIVTDEYGRVSVYPGNYLQFRGDSWSGSGSWDSGPLSPDGWEFGAKNNARRQLPTGV